LDPNVTEPGATLGAVEGGATLGATEAAVLGAVDAVDELQAAMIAGMDNRPAVPAMPLRTVLLETESTLIGSAMCVLLLMMLSDNIRQDQADCPYLLA
jgi:hypothetical protein